MSDNAGIVLTVTAVLAFFAVCLIGSLWFGDRRDIRSHERAVACLESGRSWSSGDCVSP